MARKFRVLLVDDDKSWVMSVYNELAKLRNIEADVVHSVNDALAKIGDFLYDLVFIDYKIEFKDIRGVTRYDGGLRVAAEAKSAYPTVVNIMVTAYGSGSLARESLKSQKFDDYVEKNVETDADVRAIRSLILKYFTSWNERPPDPNPFKSHRGEMPKYPVRRVISDINDLKFFSERLRQAEQTKQSRFLIFGGLGSGKSCLLGEYKKYAQRLGHVASLYDVPEDLSSSAFDEAVNKLLVGIIKGFPKYGLIDFNGFLGTIKGLGAKIKIVGVEVDIKWERGCSDGGTVLERGLKSLLEDLKYRTDVVVIMLDNIQNIFSIPSLPKILFRLLSDKALMGAPLVFGGSLISKCSDSGRGGMEIDSNLGRFFSGDLFSLNNFTEGEVRELVFNTLHGSGVTFAGEVVDLIVELTQGHPYITQLVCNRLYDCQLEGIVDKEAFQKAIQGCIIELGAFFTERYGQLSEDERRIVDCIASSDRPVGVKELQHTLLDTDSRDLIDACVEICNSLYKRQIVGSDGCDRYHIRMPAFRRYLELTRASANNVKKRGPEEGKF